MVLLMLVNKTQKVFIAVADSIDNNILHLCPKLKDQRKYVTLEE